MTASSSSNDMPPGTHTLMVKVLAQKETASSDTYVNNAETEPNLLELTE